MPIRLSSCLTALAMLLIFTSARAEAVDSRRRVLLCADVAMGLDCKNVFDSPPSAADPDDAWALAWALNHPGWDVVGVVVSFGNCACETPSTSCDAPAPEPGQVPCEILDRKVEITRWVVEACGRETPVYRGASRRFAVDGPAPDGTLEALESVLADPEPAVFFEDFGDSALLFGGYFWVNAITEKDLRKIRSDLRFAIDEVFNDNDIVIAFPQRDVHLNGALTLHQPETES